MENKNNIHPLIQTYFNLIRKNLPHGCQLKWHSNINDSSNKITIYHTYSSFTVDKSELIKYVREHQLNQIFGANITDERGPTSI